MWCIYTLRYYSATKKNEILPFVTAWMGLEGIMVSDITQRKTNAIWFHLYIESNEQNKQTKQKQNHGCREQTDGC